MNFVEATGYRVGETVCGRRPIYPRKPASEEAVRKNLCRRIKWIFCSNRSCGELIADLFLILRWAI